MDDTKSPSGRGRKKKMDTDTTISTKEKEFVEGSGLSRDEIKVGYKLMAASFDSKWYQGRIVEVDESDNTFLVHFDFWNSRFDEWYKFTTKKVKPLEEEPYTRKRLTPKFKLGDTVIARWVDGRQYRGTVERIKPNDCYDVMFEDGVVISADVTTLKLGDKLDVGIEEERLAKRNELFKRSIEREFRSKKRSLEPGATPPRLSLELDGVLPSVTAVKYASKLPDALSLKISYSLKKVCLTYEFDDNTDLFVSRGNTYDVPSAVIGVDIHTTTTTTTTTATTTTAAVEDTPLEVEAPVNSPRKRGRPRLYSPSHPSPSSFTKSKSATTPPKHISPNKNTPVKKLKNVRIPSVSPTPISPANNTPAKCTVSVQTDPIPELAETRPPVNPPVVAPQGLRPHYPVAPIPPQPAPPLLQTETVLTSDGRWITIATPPMGAQQPLQIASDVTHRQTPASNMYYQLVPMGANGPIHQPTIAPPPPPSITLPPSQPQDPLSHLVLTQPPHNSLMVLPPTRPLLQNSAPYIQPRPILQYQPHNASTVLMHANPLHQQVIQTVVNNSVQETAPQIAQRQIDPPSAMNLSANSPLPVSSLPCTSTTDPVPPVTSNLAASRATIRLPDVQAAVPVMVTPRVLSEQRENGENFSPAPILSLSSRLPFSSLLSNTIQPSPSLPNVPQVVTVSQQSGEIATIFAPSCPIPTVTTTTELSHDDPPTSDPVAPAKPPPNPSEVPAPLETTQILKSQMQAATEEQTESL